jgi:nitroreductase
MDLTTVDHLLTTTRSVRKRLDFERPVPAEVIQECLELAIQSPTGSNLQQWHFVVVTDEKLKAGVADLYRKAFQGYAKQSGPSFEQEDPRTKGRAAVVSSAVYLAQNLHRVPVFVIPCVQGRVETQPAFAQASVYGSILPAAWSLMLALRSRKLGSCWTTLHLMYEKEAAALLGVPDDVTQTCLLPVAYYTGDDFRPGSRVPAKQFTYWDGWGKTK